MIVMRKDLNMRKGKMVAQGAHAAMLAMLIQPVPEDEQFVEGVMTWFNDHGMKKICVGVESEAQLMEIHKRATEAGLRSFLVNDAGFTEFHGEPTVTCLALGPHSDEQIDAITGELTLL